MLLFHPRRHLRCFRESLDRADSFEGSVECRIHVYASLSKVLQKTNSAATSALDLPSAPHVNMEVHQLLQTLHANDQLQPWEPPILFAGNPLAWARILEAAGFAYLLVHERELARRLLRQSLVTQLRQVDRTDQVSQTWLREIAGCFENTCEGGLWADVYAAPPTGPVCKAYELVSILRYVGTMHSSLEWPHDKLLHVTLGLDILGLALDLATEGVRCHRLPETTLAKVWPSCCCLFLL